MIPLENELVSLINLSNSLIVTKDYYKLDPDDILINETIDQIEGEDCVILREGHYLNLNGNDLGIVLNTYIEQINALINEVKDNLRMPISNKEKAEYLSKIRKHIDEIESDISNKELAWIPNNLIFKNVKFSELERFEKESLSNHFLDRKKKLRQLLIFINSKNMELKDKEENTLSNDGNSLPHKKIQLVDDINLIVTLFFDLLEKKYINTSRENLSKFIVNSFIDKNRISLNKSTIDTILKPGKVDKRKTMDKRITIPDK